MAVVSKNKKALRDFEILDRIEAGVVFTGGEVKSTRNGGADLAGGFVSFEKDGAWLYAVNIAKWKTAFDPDYDAFRKRKLLLKKNEIAKLSNKVDQKGITLIPLKIYTAGRKLKMELGLVRGRKGREKDVEKRRRQQKRIASREMKDTIRGI